MEIKAQLKYPYTEEERYNFIVEYNHNLGYEIREKETGLPMSNLQAWGYTEEEIEEQQKQRRNQEIDSKIKELNEMAIPDILHGNKENIELYNEVIAGLEAARP